MFVITEALNNMRKCIAETLHNLTMVILTSKSGNYGAKGLNGSEHKN